MEPLLEHTLLIKIAEQIFILFSLPPSPQQPSFLVLTYRLRQLVEKDGMISKVLSLPNVTRQTLKRRKRKMEKRDSMKNKKSHRDPF